MSTLRARHLPRQIPEAPSQPKGTEAKAQDHPQESAIPINTQNQAQDPMSAMLPQLLRSMPNGESLSKTLQQINQMQSLIQSGSGGSLASLLPMFMGQPNGASAEGASQMMQMLPLMMQLMQRQPTNTEADKSALPSSSLSQLSSLFSLLQAK